MRATTKRVGDDVLVSPPAAAQWRLGGAASSGSQGCAPHELLLDPSGLVIGDRWVGSAPDPVFLDGRWAPDNLLVGSSMCLLGAAGSGKTQGGHRIIAGMSPGDCLVRDARGHTGLIRFRPADFWSPAPDVAAHAQAVTGGSFLARACNAAGSWRRRDNRRGRHV